MASAGVGVIGGDAHMRHTEFGGRRPYRFLEPGGAASGRTETWMDATQAAALHSRAQ